MAYQLTPQEQAALIDAGLVPQQQDIYGAKLQDAQRLMQMSQKPRSRGWLGAIDAVGNGAQYIDGKLTQRAAYEGLNRGVEATRAGGGAWANALGRLYSQEGQGMPTGLQESTPPPPQGMPSIAPQPGMGPSLVSPGPNAGAAPSAAQFRQNPRSPYSLALGQLQLGGY